MSTANEDLRTDLPRDLALAAQTLFGAGGVDVTLRSIIGLALDNIESCEHAGVLLLLKGAPTSARLSSDPIVEQADNLQYELLEGPSLEVINRGGTLCIEDLELERRWPRFAPKAAASGLRSLLALRLVANDTIGVLNLYSRVPQAFSPADRANASAYVMVASQALSIAQVRDDAERRVEELNRALSTRELIGQAQGILMERERITAERAFDMLRVASQRLNIKLLEVACKLIETGETPLSGHRLSS